MVDSRILNQAAPLVREALAGTPADRVLRDSLLRERHFSAPAERRGISRAVFAFFRWWRWLEPKDSTQKQLAAALELQARFEKSEASFKPEALAARAVPEWLAAEMDTIPAAWLRQLQRDPVLWIRPKQALRGKVAAALKHTTPAKLELPLAQSGSLSALAYAGSTDLFQTPEFQKGEFEIQDLASQLVGLACAPQPGETWWDTCAGEGGKSLHLSDLMLNKGLLWVSDRSARRLTKLKSRAARAGVFNFRSATWEGGPILPTRTKFDGILVDAPCSGIGTWQRNPHARWTTLPEDVHELAAVQARLLVHAAPALKSGGRLIYAVCTLSRAETTAVAEAFSAAHPEFEPVTPGANPAPAAAAGLTLWPQDLNANGMFIATWRRK